MTATKHFIGGESREGSGETLSNVNPANGKPIGEITVGTRDDVDAAVDAARRAFDDGWSESSGSERRKLMLRLASLIAEEAQTLAQLSTDDMGMPIGFSWGEALFAAEYLEYFAGWADKITGDVVPVPAPNVLDYTLREPVGVVGAIIPWNAPISITMFKLAPALAAGNTIVLKPSELATRGPLRIAELAARAGFPPGVLNCVTGSGAGTGAALVAHPGVDKISFTGGTETGRLIAASAGRDLKRISLELGGKSANIVCADADLDAAAAGACAAVFVMSGQQCIAGSRLLVERAVYDEFMGRVSVAARGYVVGDPLQMTTQLGPLVSQRQLDRVLAYVAEARDGATITLGGERLGGDLADGFFVGPTIVTGARNDMKVAREEIFGPVVAAIPFDSLDEAVAIANDSPYGLAGAVWTNDLSKAHTVARRIKAGTIWVNSYLAINPGAPFGGFKASGIGREGGKHALDVYTETKNVYVQLR
ncbi:MAG: aldehyde dehydrogenase [Actinomycetota bacterium]|nr:aldehyde dehydrogenase family protein [Actinomycetota bacterium]